MISLEISKNLPRKSSMREPIANWRKSTKRNREVKEKMNQQHTTRTRMFNNKNNNKSNENNNKSDKNNNSNKYNNQKKKKNNNSCSNYNNNNNNNNNRQRQKQQQQPQLTMSLASTLVPTMRSRISSLCWMTTSCNDASIANHGITIVMQYIMYWLVYINFTHTSSSVL